MEVTTGGDLPRTSAPAARALAGAGITSLADLRKHSWDEIAKLHGMGPQAIGILKAAVEDKQG